MLNLKIPALSQAMSPDALSAARAAKGMGSAKSLSGVAGISNPTSGSGVTRTSGFSDALKDALKSVSAAQNQADGLQREVMRENPKVGLEETVVAMQKANIGFQATLHVRNRMVQAYSDIMNMQV